MAIVFSHQYDHATEESLTNFYRSLSEKDRRRYAAIEARKLGHGGIKYIADLFGCDRSTVRSGIAELDSIEADQAVGRIRRTGGGRKRIVGSESSTVKNFF